MSARKLFGTTAVICPIGTPIELYTPVKPAIGQEFDVLHHETRKAVQRAKVTSFEDAKWKTAITHYRVLARIIGNVGGSHE